jgi:hypothetical protein
MKAPGPERLQNFVREWIPRPVRNWLRSPSKALVWGWDAARFSAGFTRALRIPPDISIICHPHAFKVAYESQIIDPEQSAEFQSFLASCSGTMFLFDIGAHFGVFSLAAAHFGAKAVAVDPSPIATQMIAKQAALNGWTERIQIVRAAVNDTGGTLDMLSTASTERGISNLSKGDRAKS